MPDLSTVVDLVYPAEEGGRDPAMSAARDRLKGEIARSKSARRHRRTWAFAAGGAVALTAAGVTFGPLGFGRGGLEHADAATVQVLDGAAAAVQGAPGARPPGPRELAYNHTQGFHLSSSDGAGPKFKTFNFIYTMEREDWTGGGLLRIRERTTRVRFPTDRDRLAWKEGGSSLLVGDGQRGWHDQTMKIGDAGPDIFGSVGLSDEVLSGYGSDPEGLARLLRETAPRYGGQQTDEETFTLVGDLARNAELSGNARAAVFRAAAYVADVSVVGSWTDPLGREGVVIARTAAASDIRTELIFDSATERLIGERSVVRKSFDGIPVGTVVGWTATLDQGVVDSITSRPAGANQP